MIACICDAALLRICVSAVEGVSCVCTKGFGLRGIADLKEDELVMDFDGDIYVAEGNPDE